MFFPFVTLLGIVGYAGLYWARRNGRLHEDFDRDMLSILLLALLTVGFFWRPLVAADVWMPADGGDLASFLYPTYRFAAESIRSGVFPLWNPHLYGGMPFIGDIQSGLLYPIYLLAYILTPSITYRFLEGLAAFHVFLAGTFMYLLLRFLRRREDAGGRIRRLACLAGAVTFMFSDLFIVHFGNLNMIAVAAWLPLIFLLFHRAIESRHPFWAAASGVAFAIATLAGHIQITLFIALTLGIRTVWEIVRQAVFLKRGWLGLSVPIVYCLLTGAVTFGLSAPVLLPFFQHIGFTERVSWHYSQTVQYSLAPGQFVSLLIPTFFGRGPAFHWGVWDRVEVGYAGVFPLFLGILAVALRRERMTNFWLGLLIFSFLVAMGLYAMLHGWLYQLMPGFQQLRAPARFVLVFDFALAGLAAMGLDTLSRPLPKACRRVFARLWKFIPWSAMAITALLWGIVYAALLGSQDKDPAIFMRMSVAANGAGLFALFIVASLALLGARRYGRLRPLPLGWLAIGLIFVDLSSTGSYIDLGTTDPTKRFEHPEIIQFLRSDPMPFRIDTRTDIAQFWQPDTALVYGLDDVWGIVNPLAIADSIRYWEGLGSRSSRLYDILNIKYVIARKEVELDWDKFEPAFTDAPELNVYRNRMALPRAWLVSEVVIANDHEDAFRRIHEPSFDPTRMVVLEASPEALPETGAARGEVKIVERHPNRIVVAVESDAEAVLILSEVFYPGWHATVNGRPVPIWRANYLFRALAMPAGYSIVTLRYSPLSWWIGVGCAAVTSISLIAWRAVIRRQRNGTKR